MRNMVPKPATVTALEDFLCQRVESRLHTRRSESRGTWDLEGGIRHPDDRRHDYLTLLAAIHDARLALDELEDRYAYRGRQNGADFAAIGAAAGISRQAARQRHLNRTVRRRVTLLDGPWDGCTVNVLLGQSVVRRLDDDTWPDPDDWEHERPDSGDPPIYAVYRRSSEDPAAYSFHRHENPDGTPTAAPNHALRIDRLASSWDMDPRDLFRYARRLDPTVRGERSRLQPRTAEDLHALVEEIRRERGW